MHLSKQVKNHAMIFINQQNFPEALRIFKKGFEYLKKVSKNIEKKFTPE